MQKNIFYSQRLINDDSKLEYFPVIKNVKKKQKVDINKLLNRVRIREQHEKKKKFIYLGLSILSLSIVGIFLKIF